MSWNAVDVANNMRRESAPTFPVLVPTRTSSNTPVDHLSVACLVVFVLVVLHVYQFIITLVDNNACLYDLLPMVIVFVGCMLYAKDIVCGDSMYGIIKLVICVFISYMVIPMLWDSPTTRMVCQHAKESKKENNCDD
jgi:predicted tellurium resistance membrane protein TerC